MYFETKKNQDLYMYLGKAPHGPSVKFHVVNVHTMDELKLTGNCMLGSRPVLNFDARFDTEPHLQLLKAILGDAFGTPRGHPKSKPFVDRVMSFFAVKNTIWIRNYQIVDKSERGSNDVSLVEIGPRMVLIPVRIFSGSLGGATLYQNPTFISPNEQRSTIKKSKGYVVCLFVVNVCVCVFPQPFCSLCFLLPLLPTTATGTASRSARNKKRGGWTRSYRRNRPATLSPARVCSRSKKCFRVASSDRPLALAPPLVLAFSLNVL
jgi:hypothetical protein